MESFLPPVVLDLLTWSRPSRSSALVAISVRMSSVGAVSTC